MKRIDDRPPLTELPDPTALSGNELAKSRSTRRRILDAGTALLAEQGYQRFSTGAVATRAGLTRPAMLYHFGSRRELVAAVVNHVTRRRIEMFNEAMTDLLKEAEGGGTRTRTEVRAAATDVSWAHLETPEFAAFTELVMAARTDAELESVVRPALTAFDRARRETSIIVFAVGPIGLAEFSLARDVVRFLSEGVAQQNSIIEDREARLVALKHFLKMLVASPAGTQFLDAVAADRRKTAPLSPPD